MGFKLVKGSAHDCEPAPFSDSIHNSLEVGRLGDPYTFNVSDEMLVIHVILAVGYFKWDQTQAQNNKQKSKELTTHRLILLVLCLDEVGNAQTQEQQHEESQENSIKVNGHLY